MPGFAAAFCCLIGYFVQLLGCQCCSAKKKLTCPGKIRLIPPVAQIAQSVEQRIENPRVGGSIPPLGTINNKPCKQLQGFLFWAFYCSGLPEVKVKKQAGPMQARLVAALLAGAAALTFLLLWFNKQNFVFQQNMFH